MVNSMFAEYSGTVLLVPVTAGVWLRDCTA